MKIHRTLADRRKRRIRSKIKGAKHKPRLSVYRSNKQIYVQAIDDLNRVTLAASNSLTINSSKGSKIEKAYYVGEDLGNKLKKLKVKTGIFDRGSYKYHGRVKKLAEGIRKAGIKF